jgi:hypothetical protein
VREAVDVIVQQMRSKSKSEDQPLPVAEIKQVPVARVF